MSVHSTHRRGTALTGNRAGKLPAAASAPSAAPGHLQPQPGCAATADPAGHTPAAAAAQPRQRWQPAAAGRPAAAGSSTTGPATWISCCQHQKWLDATMVALWRCKLLISHLMLGYAVCREATGSGQLSQPAAASKLMDATVSLSSAQAQASKCRRSGWQAHL